MRAIQHTLTYRQKARIKHENSSLYGVGGVCFVYITKWDAGIIALFSPKSSLPYNKCQVEQPFPLPAFVEKDIHGNLPHIQQH